MSKRKTSLKLTFNENGKGALIEQRWSELDEGHLRETSERIIAELSKIPTYEWLEPLTLPYFRKKYCANCGNKPACDETEPEKPFPYCFAQI